MITNDFTERFLRLPEVQERTGFSRSFIYKSVNDKPSPLLAKSVAELLCGLSQR